jgi:hypothetical protein
MRSLSNEELLLIAGGAGSDDSDMQSLETIEVTADASGGDVVGTVDNPQEFDTITVYASNEQLAEAAAYNALPGECSVGTLLGSVATGAVTGFVFGIGTGPGALASAIGGAGLAAFGTAAGCAYAIHSQHVNP